MFPIVICFQNIFKCLKNNNVDKIILTKTNIKSIGNQTKCLMNISAFNKHRFLITKT